MRCVSAGELSAHDDDGQKSTALLWRGAVMACAALSFGVNDVARLDPHYRATVLVADVERMRQRVLAVFFGV